MGQLGISQTTDERDGVVDSLETVYQRAILSLRIGFAVASITMLGGLLWSLAERQELDHQAQPIVNLPHALLGGNPSALIDCAILIIMLTPVVTVLLVAEAFLRTGERRYSLLSMVVLGILITSISISVLR
jgi:uncharacterized membrane protein